MYTIGEFARMAQVTRRQLLHWEELDLLKPQTIDPQNGYRYYSASQLPALNRIVALKELGLSLDQIRRFIRDDVSIDEMQGMLLLRKAELEQQIRAEFQRVRNIESRLKQIRLGEQGLRDVVVKDIVAQNYIGVRTIVPDWEATIGVWEKVDVLLQTKNEDRYGDLVGILHAGGITTDYFDLEVGRILHAENHPPLTAKTGEPFVVQELPPTKMATFVHKGPAYEAHIAFSAIGEWAELNRYAFSGPMRGVVLHPEQFEDPASIVIEVQFPIEKRDAESHFINEG